MKLPGIQLSAFEEVWLDWILNPTEEKILWAGRPTRLYQYDGTPAVLIGAILWLPIACIIFSGDTEPMGWDTPWEQLYMNMIALSLTAFLIIFPIWKRFKAKHTVCILTTQRAIIQSPRLLGRPRYQVYPLHAEMIRDSYTKKKGYGCLVFDYGLAYLGINRLVSWPIGFINIPDAAKVEQLIFHELFYKHGLQPELLPVHSINSSASSSLFQLVVGVLLLLGSAVAWFSCNAVPDGWSSRKVTITYAHADRTPSGDGAFLLQAADGTIFRVPLAGSRGMHKEGEQILIAHPSNNPLQARTIPSTQGQRIAATALAAMGGILILQSLLYYHRERKHHLVTKGTKDKEVDK